MSMGYAGAEADVIEQKTLMKLCPKALQAFLDTINKTRFSLEDVARAADYDELLTDCSPEINSAYDCLCRHFKGRTGLDLFLHYHNQQEDGDRDDQVNGVFWSVDGMYELTHAGKKMAKYVKHAHFVVYG